MRATNNIDVTMPSAEWLTAWDSYRERSAKFAYAQRETERMIAEGQPVAHLAILLPLPLQQDGVFYALRELGYTPKLRLRPGSVAPPNRPNGHMGIPDQEIGKVLYAKVGMLGPPEGPLAAGESARQWSGPGRQHRIKTLKPLVVEKKVTHEPREFELDHANVILRQWGVGAHSRRFVPHCEIRTDKEGREYKHVDENGRDRWIVEEVTDAMLERERLDRERELEKATRPAKVSKGADAQPAAP